MDNQETALNICTKQYYYSGTSSFIPTTSDSRQDNKSYQGVSKSSRRNLFDAIKYWSVEKKNIQAVSKLNELIDQSARDNIENYLIKTV